MPAQTVFLAKPVSPVSTATVVNVTAAPAVTVPLAAATEETVIAAPVGLAPKARIDTAPKARIEMRAAVTVIAGPEDATATASVSPVNPPWIPPLCLRPSPAIP